MGDTISAIPSRHCSKKSGLLEKGLFERICFVETPEVLDYRDIVEISTMNRPLL